MNKYYIDEAHRQLAQTVSSSSLSRRWASCERTARARSKAQNPALPVLSRSELTNRLKGFTMIELILVVALIAILAAAIFVAVDPARRLHEARNARRQSDIISILDAAVKYQVDNDGTNYSAISGITDDKYVILGTTANDDGLCAEEDSASAACANAVTGSGTADCVDLSSIGTNYLAIVPQDPQNGSAADTGYYILKRANGSITVGACDEEGEDAGGAGISPVIELSR